MISGRVSFAFDPLQPDTRAKAQHRQPKRKEDRDTAKNLHQVCTTMCCFYQKLLLSKCISSLLAQFPCIT